MDTIVVGIEVLVSIGILALLGVAIILHHNNLTPKH
jgi:hypothetical protein